jgi:hypothetical protein
MLKFTKDIKIVVLDSCQKTAQILFDGVMIFIFTSFIKNQS